MAPMNEICVFKLCQQTGWGGDSAVVGAGEDTALVSVWLIAG